PPRRRRGHVGRRWRPWLAAAAALVLTAGLGTQWLRDWRHDQTTATGEQRTIALRDGSTLWLNTASAVDLTMDGARRQVRLVRGEAYFDVARDPAHPFVVDAGTGWITVLGTAFGVRRDGGDVVVTVQRGRVQVAGGGSPSVVLMPGQTVRVHAGDPRKQVASVDAEQALSWRSGRLLFENRPIGEVLDELRRYDRRVLLIGDPAVRRLRVTSIVDLARIDEWYDTLAQSLPVDVTRIGPFIWIRSSPASAAANG
ncbi:MAG: FecR domain-containing protein, partial [Pseudomonas sp.]